MQTDNENYISETEKEYTDSIVKFTKKNTAPKLTPAKIKKSGILNIENFALQFIDKIYS